VENTNMENIKTVQEVMIENFSKIDFSIKDFRRRWVY
jgi:hypothetical protein